jgi:hypothetical protein
MISLLTDLDGIRVYIYASISPDQNQLITRNAGVGVFLIGSNLGHRFNVYIKAHLPSASSVFMAEAAALALAGTILHRLDINEASFLYDNNQQLATYMNTTSNEDIPR